MELELQHSDKMASLREEVATFAQQNSDVSVERFSEEINNTQGHLQDTLTRSCKRGSELQSALLAWYDFNETQRELDYMLGQERQQLQCLHLASDVVNFCAQDARDNVSDLRATTASFAFCEQKLQSLRQLAQDISPLCSDMAQTELRTAIAYMDNEVTALKARCQSLTVAMETRLAEQEKGVVMRESVGVQCTVEAEARPGPVAARRPAQSTSLLWRLLRRAFPVTIALAFLFGILCIMDPTFPQKLIFSPQLRYVRGPPPT